MTTSVQEVYCFRIKQVMTDDLETTYWRYAKDAYRSDYDPSFSTKLEDATTFTLDQTAAIVQFYQKLMKSSKVVDAEFVKVRLTTDIEAIPMDQNELLEERRRIALEKLTFDDVQALGVENLATYSKLKFHKSPKSYNPDVPF